MKKRGNLKGITLAALLVIGLTSIVSFVSASRPIATIEYAGKIVDISSDNPQIQVDLHEFGKVTTDLNVEFKISEYEEVFEVKLFSPNGDEIKMAESPSYEGGIVHVDLSEIMNSVEDVYGVYSLQFNQKGSEEVDFKIHILVDKKDPEVRLFLGDSQEWEDVKLESLNEFYKTNQLKIEVQDPSFNPDKDESYVIKNLEESSVVDWKKEGDLWIGIATLPQGKQKIEVTIEDAFGNSKALESSRSTIIDTIVPQITLTTLSSDEPIKEGTEFLNENILKIKVSDSNYNPDKTIVEINGQPVPKGDKEGEFITETLPDEEIFIKVESTDLAGNKNSITLKDIVIDTLAPEISYEFNGPNRDSLEDAYKFEESQSVKITINEKNFDKESSESFTIQSSKGSFEITEWNSKEDNHYEGSFEVTEDGQYDLKFMATDKAGNQGENKVSFIIDQNAPVVRFYDRSLTTDDEFKNGGVYHSLSLGVEIEEVNHKEATYTLERIDNETGTRVSLKENEEIYDQKLDLHFFSEVNESLENIFTEDGTYILTIVATDQLDHTNDLENGTITFTIDREAPSVANDFVFEVESSEDVTKDEESNVLYFNEKSLPTFKLSIEDYNLDLDGIQITINKDGESYQHSDIKLVSEESPKHYLQLAFEEEGEYELVVEEVTDKAGNESENLPNSVHFFIDRSYPEISFNQNEVKELSNTNQTLKFEIKDKTYAYSNLVIKKTDYVSGGEPEEIYNQDFKETKIAVEMNDVDSTLNGTYTVIFTAFDKVRHITEMEEYEFTIDTVAPKIDEYRIVDKDNLSGEIRNVGGVKYYNNPRILEIYITEYHFNPDNCNSDQVSIDLTYQSSLMSNEDKTFKFTQTCEKVNDTKDQYVIRINIPNDGYYWLKDVHFSDDADNTAVIKPQPEKVVIDTVKPVISVTGVENDFYYKNGDAVTVNVSIDEINFYSALSTYEIYRKETLKSEEKLYLSGNITSQTDFKLPTLTENGEYRIILTATDMSDNKVEKDTELHFYIDHNDPKVSIKPLTSNTANGSQQNVSEVILALSAADDWKLAETKYTVKRNNEDYSAYDKYDVETKENLESFKLRFKEEGFYQVELQTNDEARNGVVTQSFEFTIDRTSPAQLNIVGNANHHNANTVIADGGSYSAPRVNLNFAAQDLYSFDYMAVNVLRNGSPFAAQTFNLQEARSDFDTQFSKDVGYSLSEEGEYEVTFIAYDQAGNKNDQKVSFEIDRTAPAIDSNIEDGKYYNSDFLPEFNLDQPDRDEFTFINIDDTNYKGRVPVLASDKVYTISALATDKAQNTTDYYATLTVDKTPPAIGISNLISGFFKDTLSPSIFYNDTNLDSSTVSIKLNNVDLGPGVGDENGYTKEIAIDKDGTYSLEITVGDLATNVSKQTIDFVLDNESPTIIIKNPITLYNQPWIPELEVLEEYGYDIVMVTLNGVEHDITQPITTEGKNVLFIELMDKSGNVSSLTLQFILDLTPPKVIVEDAATNQLVKDGDRYLTSLDLKIYLDYVSQEGQEDTERITKISLNGEDVADSVTIENGRKVYRLSVTEFKDYTLEVTAVDDAQNKTVEVINFTLGDKDIFTKIYENKPIFYSLITITGLAVLGSGVYGVIVLKSKSKNTEDSSEE